jgi:flagellar biosynthesis protein
MPEPEGWRRPPRGGRSRVPPAEGRMVSRAAALRYDPESGGAPTVVAAGSGELAERIIALAREHGVPVREDARLAQALARLELEAQVPPELWDAVAQALVWAYRLSARG